MRLVVWALFELFVGGSLSFRIESQSFGFAELLMSLLSGCVAFYRKETPDGTLLEPRALPLDGADADASFDINPVGLSDPTQDLPASLCDAFSTDAFGHIARILNCFVLSLVISTRRLLTDCMTLPQRICLWKKT